MFLLTRYPKTVLYSASNNGNRRNNNKINSLTADYWQEQNILHQSDKNQGKFFVYPCIVYTIDKINKWISMQNSLQSVEPYTQDTKQERLVAT